MNRFFTIVSLFLIVTGARVMGQQITVDDVATLKIEVETATSDLEIQLSNKFPNNDEFDRELTDVISLDIQHHYNIKIIGNSSLGLITAANKKHLNLTGNGSGELTLENLNFYGLATEEEYDDSELTHITVGGGVSGSYNGKVIIDNCLFKQIKGDNGVLSVSAPEVEIKNTSFLSNAVMNGFHAGSAITISGGDYNIKNCSFAYNYTRPWQGYIGGAICVGTGGSSDCNISNSIFYKNKSFTNGGGGNFTNQAGSGGGAIGCYQSGRSIHISNCIFEENILDKYAKSGSTADGGAIYFYYTTGANIIDGCTFVNNKAFDEGGAIAYVAAKNADNSVQNCTFDGNIAEGRQLLDGIDGGGAIEVDTEANVSIAGNTFIRNIAEKGSNQGGALAITGNSSVYLVGNIVCGNSSAKGEQNVYVNSNSTITSNYKTLNIIDESLDIIFASDPVLIAYGSIKAGDPKWENENEAIFGIVKTIPILPCVSDILGIADEAIDNSMVSPLDFDQNGRSRITDSEGKSDAGSVEILWAKFDAYIDGTDDGYWEGLSDLTYDGTIFYEKDGEDKAKEYFVVSHYDGTIGAQSTIPEPIHSTLSFGGWVEIDEDGTEIGDWDGLAFDLTSNRRFRAKWDGGTTPTIYDIIYHPNGGGGTSQTIPAEDDNTHTILKYTDTPLEFTPPANHVFAGWNTLADGSGAAYVVNTTTEPLEANLELYALWTARPVTPEEPEEPEPDLTAILQWSVSTTTPSAFVDVENNTRTIVYEGTPVYLQIRPIVNVPSRFDSWEIEYTAIPADYHHSMTPISGTLRYNFNEGQPHLLPGTYIYTVHSLTLYRYGNAVAAFDFETSPYEHTIIINSKPDPNTDPAIQLRDIAGYCADETELRIPYSLIYEDYPVEYTVIFSDKAKIAGFKDITEYTLLPDNYISIPIPAGVPFGKYQGEIMLRCEENPDIIPNYPFEVEILPTVQIVRQPETVISGKCVGDGFRIEVEATGLALSYQWYHNDQIIVGATSASYEAALADETTGTYYVVVTGTCGMVVSDKVNIGINALTLLIKWDDVLYVVNTDNRYTRFQWYKDGQAINMNGNSIYYTDQAGLQGTYFLRAYTSADSYEESCPVTFSSISRASRLSVYPNIVSQNYHVTIESDEVGETYIGAAIDMFNMAGQKVYAGRVTSAKVEIPMTVPSGSYILHITAANGKKTVEKIIVK